MTLASIFQTVESAIAAFFESILHPPQPVTPINVEQNLVDIIESRSISIGPMLGTGGVVHAVSAAQAKVLAPEIIAGAKAASLRLSLLQALLDGESRDDASAFNPNHQDDTPGETADEKLDHEDAGVEQEDVSTAKDDPAFAGLTDEQIIVKLLDPVYGIGFAARTLARNIAFMRSTFAIDPTLIAAVKTVAPGFDPAEVAGANAYNAGPNGTINTLRSAKPNLAYGIAVLTKAKGWASELDL